LGRGDLLRGLNHPFAWGPICRGYGHQAQKPGAHGDASQINLRAVISGVCNLVHCVHSCQESLCEGQEDDVTKNIKKARAAAIVSKSRDAYRFAVRGQEET